MALYKLTCTLLNQELLNLDLHGFNVSIFIAVCFNVYDP